MEDASKVLNGGGKKAVYLCLLIFLFLFGWFWAIFGFARGSLSPAPLIAPAFNPEIVALMGDQTHKCSIPESAIRISPDVFYLGPAFDPNHRLNSISGYVFVFTREAAEMNISTLKKPNIFHASNCFGFIAEGARWKTGGQYVLDTTNTKGLSAQFIEETVSSSINIWDDLVQFNIVTGRDVVSTVDGVDFISPDGKNEILFADFTNDNIIAQVTVWGNFNGPLSGRFLQEADMAFNNHFKWGDVDDCSDCMDFSSIFRHEFGHWVGLTDQQDSQCSEVTMFFASSIGETKKRSLEPPDITGAKILYGEENNGGGGGGNGPSSASTLSISLHIFFITLILVV